MSRGWSLVVGLLVPIALVVTGGAAAGEPATPPQKSGEHKRVGEIVWVDVAGRTFAMKETLKSGERKEISFVLAPDVKILIRGKAADLKEMKAGDSVTVRYVEQEGRKVAFLCDVAKPVQKPS
jgi:hypothetical protein